MYGVNTHKYRWIIWSVFISILIHLILFWMGYLALQRLPSRTAYQKPEEVFKVKFFNPTKKETAPLERGRIVDLNTDENEADSAPDTQNLSDKNRKVLQEMQAKSTSSNPGGSTPPPANLAEPLKKYSFNLSQDFLKSYETRLEEKYNDTPAQGSGGGPRNYLPDVGYGVQTMLNTREFKYASFFIRMKRQIESVWTPFSAINPRSLNRRMYLTTLNIILDTSGNLEKVDVSESCGIPALDREAVRSIETSSPFLNPPKGMIAKDNRVYITDLRFIVTMGGVF